MSFSRCLPPQQSGTLQCHSTITFCSPFPLLWPLQVGHSLFSQLLKKPKLALILLEFCGGVHLNLLHFFFLYLALPPFPFVFSGSLKVTALQDNSSKYNPSLVCLRDNKIGSIKTLWIQCQLLVLLLLPCVFFLLCSGCSLVNLWSKGQLNWCSWCWYQIAGKNSWRKSEDHLLQQLWKMLQGSIGWQI